MRILILHNRYQQPGGEDAVVLSEIEMLRENGHDVRLLQADNDSIRGITQQIKVAVNGFYSFTWKRRLENEIEQFRPDVVHTHNLFPVITPSVIWTCAEKRIPLVQTIHNYRLCCPNALLFRESSPCELCLGRAFAWPGVRHGCYRNSRAGTFIVSAISCVHRAVGTFTTKVDRFIALTEFAREKLVQAGLPAERIEVKPNFLERDPGVGSGDGEFFLFVGRLSTEKGIEVLLEAWNRNSLPTPLKVIGDGPLADRCRSVASTNHAIEILGQKSPSEVLDWVGRAKALIVPSICYEGFPRAIVESFAKGTPVICSKRGSMQWIIEHGKTGFHCAPGDVDSIVEQVQRIKECPRALAAMRIFAREDYEQNYTSDANHRMLTEIYERAMSSRSC